MSVRFFSRFDSFSSPTPSHLQEPLTDVNVPPFAGGLSQVGEITEATAAVTGAKPGWILTLFAHTQPSWPSAVRTFRKPSSSSVLTKWTCVGGLSKRMEAFSVEEPGRRWTWRATV